MEFDEITYQGPPIDDTVVLAQLPAVLRQVLAQVNGFIAYGGGLHIRGTCNTPAWHALDRVWHGERALHRAYGALLPTDIPFGQDAVGDQFILRDEAVYRLDGETGALTNLDRGLLDFFADVAADPIEVLGLRPLHQFRLEGGMLLPGQLLSVYPPFCTVEAAAGVTLRAVDADERLTFLAHFSAQIATANDGDRVRIVITDE
ncbi:MAG TPA: hypothetical protein VIL85_14930 [Thermomicrobiales bacterium]|jgi:hypothetical protein